MCKKVEFLPHKECLLISDEDKYIKILSYDPNNKKFKLEKEYFVSQFFGNESLNQLSTMCFNNGVLYSNNGTYLLQERGMQKNELEVMISEPEQFDYNTLHFPLVSSRYCIKQITNYEDRANELYISPPFNSHKVANSQQDKFTPEFFSPDDSSKLIRISSPYYNQKIDLCEMNGNVVSSKIVEGSSIDGKLPISQNGRYMFRINQTTEYITKKNEQGEEVGEYLTTLKTNVVEISLDSGSQTQSRDSELNDGRDQLHKKEDHGELNNQIITRVIREFEYKSEEGYGKITDNPYSLENHVLNNGDAVSIYFYQKYFLFNGKNHFEELDALLTRHCKELKKNKDTGGYEGLRYTLGQDFIVFRTEKHLYSVRFNPQGPKVTSFFYRFKKLRCSPIIGYQNISMDNISATCHPDRILIIYDFKESKNIMVWDIKEDIEVTSFAPREGENFLFYAYGPYKEVEESLNHSLGIKPQKKTAKAKVEAQSGDDPIEPPSENFDGGEEEDDESSENKYRISHTGYLIFDKYYVNCTTMVPTPFIRVDPADSLYPSEWHKGPKVNFDESLILARGNLYSAISYQDIDFRQKRDQLDASKTETCTYFVDRKSIVLDYVMEDAKLFKIVEQLEKDPLFLLMILTPDRNNKTPLDEAINNNSPRVVELFLNALIKVGDFKLTNAFTPQFLELFKMGVEAFRHFLHCCYFTTEQMEMMKKMSADKKEGIYRLPTSSSILDDKFNKVFLEDKKIDAKKNEDDDEEDNKAGLGNSFDDDEEEKEEETLMSDVSIPEGDEDTGSGEAGSHKVEKRVEVKAIEFDWMLTTKEGEDFLEGLRQTDNLAYFEIDVVKDLILFQWSYFLPRIIMFLFVPFLVFFIMFILYTTWILDEMFSEEDDNGDWHTAALVIGICVLVFQVFFIYVEIRQIFFHKLEYLKSFWNMLDIASVILNIAVVVLHLTDVREDDLNAVSSIAVLVLWFRLFYLLRVFSETAYLISMIQAIILEMKYFVLALLIAILAFANTFYILGRNDEENFAGENVWDAFIFSYKMGLGDFDTDGFGTVDEGLIWTLWFLNTFIILIILLNLVIAIMGDTFDRVQETQESTMLQEFASIMRENEFIVSRKRIFKGIKYMVVVQPEKAEGGVTTSWEGKLNQLKRFLEDSSEKHIVHLRKMEKKMEKMIEFGLEEKLKPLEDKVNQKITSLEFRLQKTNKIFEQYPVKELLDKVLKMKG
jgi:hypothetical protein